MSGTIRKITILTGILLMTATVIWAAPTHVNNIRLSHEGNFTVLTVEGNGVIRIAHQSVEAKEGKPFRIVLDCLASRHMLPDKSFSDLPACVITDIRTSQYAVTPEEVVRIVLDLREESVYRVEQSGNSVQVMVSDTKTPAFTAWTSAQPVTEKAEQTAVAQKSEEKPAALQPPSVPVKKPSVVAATAPEPVKSAVRQTPKAQPEKNTAMAQAEASGPSTQPAGKTENTVKRDTPVDSKPVPLQVKLGLTGKSSTVDTPKSQPSSPVMAQKQEAPARKTEPVVVAEEKPQPQAEEKQAVPSVQKKPSILAHRKNTEPVKVTVNPNIANDTIERAIAFASVNPNQDNPPRPGDEPKPKSDTKGVANHDTKNTPAPAAKKQPSPTADAGQEKAAAKPAVKATADKPVLAQVKETPKSNPPAPKKITALPAPKKDDKTTVAEAKTDAVPQPGPAAAKKPSRYRRDAAKTARLKQAQVVQFPQRIVIKYKGASGRDPFKTLIDNEKKSNGRVDLNKIPNIETLHLVGVIEAKQKGGKDAALMEDLDGIGYILKTGDRVRNGYVAQIDEQAIYFQINEYGWSRTVVKEMEKE